MNEQSNFNVEYWDDEEANDWVITLTDLTKEEAEKAIVDFKKNGEVTEFRISQA
jgi:hypothetical protein